MTQPESRTVEERLAAALWDAFSSKPHAEHVPGDCSTCDAYRELANQDAGLILAAAKEHGLVIGEGERLNVDALREALYTISVRHNWEQMTDTVDRTEEIAAEYERLRR